ncbi:MAG: Ig-like domain-containing protein, partial [Vicinamibacterales bacterium]
MVTEGDSGTQQAVFTITLSEPSFEPVHVRYMTADDSATAADSDYAHVVGEVVFNPGETTATISIAMTGDTDDELHERLLVNLFDARNATIADANGIATITNDDTSLRGSINGALWDDLNGNSLRDAGEDALAGWTMYIDANNNGQLDSSEISTTTDTNGEYEFTNLPAGQYTIKEVLQDGWNRTNPLGTVGVAQQQFLLPLTSIRDFVYDNRRRQLFVTTEETVERLNLATMGWLEPLLVGNNLSGIDITPDGASLYVAERLANVTQGFIRKVNLDDGSVTNLTYDLATREVGAFDVAIASTGLAFVTTLFTGSGGWVPFRQLDTSTDALTIRTDDPGVRSGEIGSVTRIYRSADGNWMLVMEGTASTGPMFTYSAISDNFPAFTEIGTRLFWVPAAINYDGSLVALNLFDGDLEIRDESLDLVTTIPQTGRPSGLIFDPVRDVLYRAGTSEIIVMETGTFAEAFRFPIGDAIDPMQFSGARPMAMSDEGRVLFLGTDSGVHVYRMIVDSHRVDLPAGGTVTISHQQISSNHLPVADDDAAMIIANQTVSIDVLANDSDGDGDPLTILITGQTNGTATIDDGGTPADPGDDRIQFTPTANFNGTSTVTYKVSDGVAESEEATVTITVVNAAPIASDNEATTDEDTPVIIDVLANDSDPDGDILSVANVTHPLNGTAILNADGTVTYTPAADFHGTDSFTYTVSDGQGGTDTATVTLNVIHNPSDDTFEFDLATNTLYVNGTSGDDRIEFRGSNFTTGIPISSGTTYS